MRQKRGFVIFALGTCLLLSGVVPTAMAQEKSAQKEQSKAGLYAQKAAGKDETVKKDVGKGGAGAKDEKAATVNNKVITMSSLNDEMSRYERQLGMAGQTPDEAQLAEMRTRVLDGLINREILKQESEKQGIKIEPQEVDDQLASLKKRFPNEADFQSTLSKMNLTEETLKLQFSQDLAVQKLIDTQVAGKVVVTPEETRSFYDSNPDLFKAPEMVRASHILVKVDPKATDDDKKKAKEKIQGLQKKIKEGADFAAVAKENSDCPSAENGGDLDYFQKGQMVAPFENAAFALKPGDVSDVVETQFGYHLIKVTDKKEAGMTPYEEIDEKIEQHLKQEKVNKQVNDYIAQLKSQAKIETYLK